MMPFINLLIGTVSVNGHYLGVPLREFYNYGEIPQRQYPPFGRKNRSWSIWHMDPSEAGGVTYPNEDMMWTHAYTEIWHDDQGPYQPRKNQVYEWNIQKNEAQENKKWIDMENEFLGIPGNWDDFAKDKQMHISKRQFPFNEFPRGGHIIGVLMDEWNWTYFRSPLKQGTTNAPEATVLKMKDAPVVETTTTEIPFEAQAMDSLFDNTNSLSAPAVAAPHDLSAFRSALKSHSRTRSNYPMAFADMSPEERSGITNPFKGRYMIDPKIDQTDALTIRSDMAPFASLAAAGYVKYPFEWPNTVIPDAPPSTRTTPAEANQIMKRVDSSRTLPSSLRGTNE